VVFMRPKTRSPNDQLRLQHTCETGVSGCACSLDTTEFFDLSTLTQQRLGWRPKESTGLIDNLNHYNEFSAA
jgi:hypothetical protein